MLIRDIADLIQAGGEGTVGINIFLGQLPVDPDGAVAIYPTGGFKQTLPIPAVKATAQVIIRALGYEDAYNRAWRIFSLLDDGGKGNKISPSGREMVIKAMQPPFFLERDETGRVLFVFNIEIWTGREVAG
ncbi:hypothetical protein SAMN02745885_01654 [Carboxydocella sporoproducens DSM 16521]|uniref:Tail terminator n=2 Tax=Carboxydocella TaxID=178898 RepID=A0A1T4QFN8_9FIRM|nr:MULTISPECIES: minor capsid protein [Carboxydocella]AVX21597.1 hypothetical protein CFE_2454 [Carboxydocella thermautotrophica]SKA02524.1 hypothetical protein SAMN02745885_01654 [Carboxydocella sporoproducens DSM 16521]